MLHALSSAYQFLLTCATQRVLNTTPVLAFLDVSLSIRKYIAAIQITRCIWDWFRYAVVGECGVGAPLALSKSNELPVLGKHIPAIIDCSLGALPRAWLYEPSIPRL